LTQKVTKRSRKSDASTHWPTPARQIFRPTHFRYAIWGMRIKRRGRETPSVFDKKKRQSTDYANYTIFFITGDELMIQTTPPNTAAKHKTKNSL